MGLFSSILSAIPIVGPIVGQVASGIEGNAASGRAAEQNAAQIRDRTLTDRYQAEQNARTQLAALEEKAVEDRADRFQTASKTRAQQVGLGDILANLQDAKISGLPSYIPNIQVSGGLRPSNLGPLSRQAGSNLAQQALAAQMSGADIPSMPDLSSTLVTPPELTPSPQAGGADTFLNVLSAIGLGAKGYGEYKKQKKAADQEAQAGPTATTSSKAKPVMKSTPIELGQEDYPAPSNVDPNLMQYLAMLAQAGS